MVAKGVVTCESRDVSWAGENLRGGLSRGVIRLDLHLMSLE